MLEKVTEKYGVVYYFDGYPEIKLFEDLKTAAKYIDDINGWAGEDDEMSEAVLFMNINQHRKVFEDAGES